MGEGSSFLKVDLIFSFGYIVKTIFMKKAPMLLFVLVLFAGLLIFLNFQNNFFKVNNEENNIQTSVNSLSLEYDCEVGKTAFEVLEEKASNVEFEGSSFGRMVTGINGIKQGSGKYWLYFINGKDATISADSYICSEEEKIKWELR